MCSHSEPSRSSTGRANSLDLLISADAIGLRVREMANEIDRCYEGREVLVAVVLKGAFVFAADLIRCMETPVTIDFIRLESYCDGISSTGDVRVVADLSTSVEDREVLVVEDIIDTGYSLDFLLTLIHERGARDVRVCALLDKPSRRLVGVEPDFVGFTIPDLFVVGYGIDHAQRYRNLPDIHKLATAQEATEPP